MDDYLLKNTRQWEPLYEALHVESHVFRPFGRILAKEFGLTGAKRERVLDFGCASGATLSFYKSKGFDVYGVDLSCKNIEACCFRMPDIADHFGVIEAFPKEEDVYFGGDFDLILAMDSLYYYTDEHLAIRLMSLCSQLKPGGVIYATMIGSKNTVYMEHSDRCDNGLYRVNSHISGCEHFINVTHSEEELCEKFSIFDKRHTGFHSYRFCEQDGTAFFYTYIGEKRADSRT